jgi:hypothetical protein
MRRSTRLHSDQAVRKFREEGDHLFAMQLLHKNGMTGFIHAVRLKDALRKINVWMCISMLLFQFHSFSAQYTQLRGRRRPHHQASF